MEHESTPVESFQQAYQGQPPWDVGHAQQALITVSSRIQGSILDAGCGTGDNAIHFARQGHVVYGIDFVAEAIDRAKSKAEEAQVNACFLVADALELRQLPILFDNVIDCGLFHVFSDEDRPRYVQSLCEVVRQEGYLWLLCFSDREPPGHGPRRITTSELEQAFADGWSIASIEASRFETSSHVPPGTFSDGGPHAWLAIIQRLH